jgi:hypothetical protein
MGCRGEVERKVVGIGCRKTEILSGASTREDWREGGSGGRALERGGGTWTTATNMERMVGVKCLSGQECVHLRYTVRRTKTAQLQISSISNTTLGNPDHTP